ncbi:MAG: primosomal protein N' [Planctomycetes bacterium]|nr:primosomal protein N' [Planctomycetota bacterium]MBI3833932.1 primosomal protein N' [Planctomycetota bacterium]
MHVEQTGRLWIEEGEPHVGTVADVAPILPLFRTLTFGVPPDMETQVSIGQRVSIPVGRSGRLVRGFVIGLDRRAWDNTLRPIDSLLDTESHLTPHLVALGREISEHYHCPLGATLKAMTPQAVRRGSGLIRVRYAELTQDHRDPEDTGAKRASKKRLTVIEALRSASGSVSVQELRLSTGASSELLRRMVKDGVITISHRDMPGEIPEPQWTRDEPEFSLNESQQAAVRNLESAMTSGGFGVRLLFGVSGSGKTEVYIHAIRRALADGKQAILLVPEIMLTTQLVSRLASRFEHVAVVHSELTDVHRSLMWREIAGGVRDVVIGTRSAVFAPCPRLGLICVDEEQESSYKNMQAPRFHVRDVAIMRAKLLEIPVVLGSATPVLETWHRSTSHPAYARIELPDRVRSLPLPDVHIVDMREEIIEQKRPVIISRLMQQRLGETLSRGEQAILLMNRRGFANRLFCPQCKTRITCPQCNVGLVMHSATGNSICHYCHQRIATPANCPNLSCGAELVHVGFGTQRVEQVLAELFSSARLRRADSDTMRHRSHYQSLIDDFAARRIDILVGTQMIAKGLDFPGVSLVGIVSAEASGLASDFRAQERLFQLVTQTAGRAGRADVPGRVIIQTITPDLPALQFSLHHDYAGFAQCELRSRQHVGWPPFRRLARIVVSHSREEIARREAEMLFSRVIEAVRQSGLPGDLLGPNPCFLSRLRGKYRWELLIRTANAVDLCRLMQELESKKAFRPKSASTILDVDPVDFV